MTYYAFTARHEQKAALELREAGYDAFCLMRTDRRKKSRNAKSKVGYPVVAIPGYIFAENPDPWTVSKMGGIFPVRRSDGKWQKIPTRQVEWLLNPPRGLFKDTEAHKHICPSALPSFNPGDTVAMTLACERISGEVVSTDGATLLLKLNRIILGRDTLKVPARLIEVD